MRFNAIPTALTLLLAALPAASQQQKPAQQHEEGAAFLRVPAAEDGGDRIHSIRARVRHTTVIVLPPDERILDFVAGDSEYWHLTGAANVAYLKPLAEDAATNVALVCESGRIYSFLVSEHGDEPPHLVVRVEDGTEAAGMSGAGAPAFVARSEVAAYREMAAEAAEAARRAQAAAAAEIEAFRASYPTRLAFEYRLDRDASRRPFLVEAMWHDGQFTYLRSRAQEAPALYELRDGEPSLVAFDLGEDGLYVARPGAGRRMAPDRRRAAALAVRARGRAMSRWKQWIKEPKGALPGGIVTKAGIALIGVLIAGMLFSSSLTGPEEDPMAPAPPEAQAVDERAGRAFEGRLRAEAERHAQQAAADDARADRERRQAEAETAGAGGQSGIGSAERGAGGGGDGAAGMVQAEYELREALRLEEIERRTRSLPVSQTYRDPNEARGAARLPAVEPEPPEAALDRVLASFGQSVAALEAEMQGGLAAEGLLPGSPGIPALGAPSSVPGTAEPGLSVRPLDPPGWERIREGSFLEAVLLTQLSGEFPGPVLAMVSVPLYSADRQRVLIPRGACVVGTARAVQDRDQSRLAVAFHRLLMPDGSWIDLEFAGLNQAGEGALKDRVNRHYFSTFAAAGAVGALSGLSLAGASPYGLRAGVGQGHSATAPPPSSTGSSTGCPRSRSAPATASASGSPRMSWSQPPLHTDDTKGLFHASPHPHHWRSWPRSSPSRVPRPPAPSSTSAAGCSARRSSRTRSRRSRTRSARSGRWPASSPSSRTSSTTWNAPRAVSWARCSSPFHGSRPGPSGSCATGSPGDPTSRARPARRSMPSGIWEAAAARSPDCGGARKARPTGWARPTSWRCSATCRPRPPRARPRATEDPAWPPTGSACSTTQRSTLRPSSPRPSRARKARSRA